MARKRRSLPSEGMAFFRPDSVAALTAALAWVDANNAGDVDTAWTWGGDRTAWSVLQLPSPRLHPHAARLFAAAAGVRATAIAAVLDRRAFVDDDGVIRLWPWYPEEDAVARPVAEAQARELGVELPRECLDEPYEPAHYDVRATADALLAWLERRGIVDAAAVRIERVPFPPQQSFAAERYEGGLRAPSLGMQALRKLARSASLFKYVADDPAQCAELEARIDRELAAACAVFGGDAPGAPAAHEPEPIAIPELERSPVGRIQSVFALARGALLVTDGALIAIDRAGAFVGAWAKPLGFVFARKDIALVNYSHALDLAAGRWIEGELLELARSRMGMAGLPGTRGHDERTEPVLSACGAYLLDVDESPYIVRFADGVTVAEDRALEKALEPAKPGSGLVAPEQVAVAAPVVIDGVRFVVRSGESPVRDGRSLAFALAGDQWRFLVGNVVRERGRIIARVGVPVLAGAFRDDGRELWVLASDHAIRIELDGAPAVGAIVPLQPILDRAEAAR